MIDKKLELFFKIKKQVEDLSFDCVKSDNERHYDMAYQILDDLNYFQDFLDLENTHRLKEKHFKEFNEKYFDKKDPIIEDVITKYRKRSQEGIKKYGTTLADNNLSPEEWLTHLQEALMDAVVYLEKIKQNSK